MGSAGLSQVTTAQGDTSGNADPLPSAASEERFKVARRGYDRHQVDEYAARSRRDAVGMRNRLVKALREAEQLRVDLAAARQAAWEAAAQKDRVARELAALRTHAEMALARNLWWPSPPQDDDAAAC
ncbi:MAG TPA: hypothetical protein VGF32_30095 [Streptosporangiaceae bacterium]